MKKTRVIYSLMVGVALAWMGGLAWASSHREAPFITEHPKVDAADFYMFRDYDPSRSGFVVFIADYLPLQAAYGGPNYFSLDPDALYEIHVDNNGDSKEDITFQFRFKNEQQGTKLTIGGKSVAIPLINFGGISASDTSKLNFKESYGVKVVRGNRRTGTGQNITNASGGSATFAKPVDNIGNKSIPNYQAYASSHIYGINIPGCATQGGMFVGQRKDPFAVNLGEAFDLINTNPLGTVDAEKDSLKDKNVTSIMLHVPIACLTQGTEPVIGAWTTASLRQGRLLNPKATFASPSKEGGPWVQVSRLGAPLVNEVVIGLGDKDRFNASKPMDDGQFADYVTHPTFPALIEILYPSAPAPTLFPRTDLVAAFLTGVKDLNQPANVVASEMLRLNTNTVPTPVATQNNLGVIGGDNAGFPNGRRPGDDVVDIALRVVMGKLISLGLFGTTAQAPAGGAALTDGVLVNAAMFDPTFPFLKTPIPGSPN
jgi:hypothetical protein